MDKPTAMSVKDYLYRVMSVSTNTPEKIIAAVVNHQFEGVMLAMDKPGIHSIEVSGFGKFLFNTKKSQRMLAAYIKSMDTCRATINDPNATESKKEHASKTLASMEVWLEKSKPKFNGANESIGGVEEPLDASRGIEDSDSGDLKREDENL